MELFDIKILRLQWLEDDGKDDVTDKCLHGEVSLTIAGRCLSSSENGSWAVSSTALFLLRTISESRNIGDYESEMLPHCGHFFMPDHDTGRVAVMGCGIGVDWLTIQTKDSVVLRTSEGYQERIGREEYRRKAVQFADEVEAFYISSLPKTKDSDEWSQKGYEQFRRELRTLLNQNK